MVLALIFLALPDSGAEDPKDPGKWIKTVGFGLWKPYALAATAPATNPPRGLHSSPAFQLNSCPRRGLIF
ncbi:uncharacterized protein LAJ45_01769 [Morchella importuna]|uniref:uncharacterized protein n=1 Tax=Morchella importuna TaxID=1174673 RepID=UPI001E8DA763|nr:uncharacterized protein LAJ45_01769 [Morchella importuna]KAH8154002.1 hypothetical protein LAJ45_01769 [Morchella importuna]